MSIKAYSVALGEPGVCGPYGSETASILACPVCGEGYLHHLDTIVYSRDGEDQDGKVTVVYGSGATGNGPFCMESNPSRRRDGLRITFYCECCGSGSANLQTAMPTGMHLCILQHKGSTYMYWEVSD